MFYRPCRERSVDEIMEAVLQGLDATGWDEVSLLSLSTSDYPRLDELLARLVPELERRHVSLALPSLRPETITSAIVSASSTVTKSGFTLAPEAGTERLRRVVRKDFSDEDIVGGVSKILAGGWQILKLYFMIGLPTETDEDLDGVAGLVERILALPRRQGRFSLGVSISPFVPKPHTPFQWERQCSASEFRAKEEYLARRIKSRYVNLSLRDPSISVLEGVLARGDRRLWPVLRRAYELGCRFDGWRDELKIELWERAFAECGLDVAAATAARPLDEPLPWDAFELHASKKLLLAERDRAYGADVPARNPVAEPPMDSSAGTSAPELSPGREAPMDSSAEMSAPDSAQGPAALARGPIGGSATGSEPRAAGPHEVYRYRVVFEKRGRARFLSHLEMLNVIQRALRRSGLPLSYSEGFHPHPKLSAGPSLAVGMEGFGEFFDVELLEPAGPTPELLNRFLPPGLSIKACAGPFSRKEGKLPQEARFTYALHFEGLRALLKSSGSPSEMLSPAERMWYLLAKELGIAGSLDIFECGAPVDPAPWFEAEWRRMFERGASVKNEKGKERSCAGCAVRLVEIAARDRAGAPDSASLELVLPGAEGAPRPQDLLMAFMPKNIASLVRIQRLEIRYLCGEDIKDPVEAIGAKLPEI